ncbi:MAG: hypothetical protein SFU91_14365 [Chloroherpetonaceae bacterium]|nr:hypothetical protein [Chloroherpetonaceae bacterium]
MIGRKRTPSFLASFLIFAIPFLILTGLDWVITNYGIEVKQVSESNAIVKGEDGSLSVIFILINGGVGLLLAVLFASALPKVWEEKDAIAIEFNPKEFFKAIIRGTPMGLVGSALSVVITKIVPVVNNLFALYLEISLPGLILRASGSKTLTMWGSILIGCAIGMLGAFLILNTVLKKREVSTSDSIKEK